MKKIVSPCIAILSITHSVHAYAEPGMGDGLIKLKSPYSVNKTIDRLESVLNNRDMIIFKRISHNKGACSVGLELRDTELLIFGNPKIGTLLMQCEQTAAIDLPQKALAYEDKKGQVWLAYNNPEFINLRHNISECDSVVKKIGDALSRFANAAVSGN